MTFRLTADDALEIELVGDLARMVHLAQNSSENSPIAGAVHEEFACSVKVVAGVGFEPTTFRYEPDIAGALDPIVSCLVWEYAVHLVENKGLFCDNRRRSATPGDRKCQQVC